MSGIKLNYTNFVTVIFGYIGKKYFIYNDCIKFIESNIQQSTIIV